MLKQTFSKMLEDAVAEYYLPHRDRNVHLCKFVTDNEGDTMLLVRFNDDRGIRMSAMLSYCRVLGKDGNPAMNVREEYAVYRSEEENMMAWYMNGMESRNAPKSLVLSAV